MQHSISPPRYTSPSPTPTSRFHCLQVRLLHEKCGHIETLVIHELPCQKLHRGWLQETSPYVHVKACLNMSRYLAIKKASCARCNVPTLVVVKRGFFGWGMMAGKNVDAGGDIKVTEKGKGEEVVLPIQEIVRRRREWLREMERQEERKRGRDEEIKKLKKMRDH